MHPSLLITAFLLAGCFTTRSRGAPASTPPQAGASATSSHDPFPAAKQGFSIKAGTDGDTKLTQLVDDFSRVTGNTLVFTKEVRQLLDTTSSGLNHTLDVPADQVYPIVESILVQNDFMLVLRNDRDPRLLAIESLNINRRGGFKTDAAYVLPDRIHEWARHPAFLVTTVVDLKYTDVRTLANSLRTMFTDQNTQQIVPIGNSNTLLVTGNGAFVASLVAMLHETDEYARAAWEEARKTGPAAKPSASNKDAPPADDQPK
jgi:hypothetical protein